MLLLKISCFFLPNLIVPKQELMHLLNLCIIDWSTFFKQKLFAKKGNAAFGCKSLSAFVKCSKILCISTPTFFDRFPKFPILTRLFLLWFVARKGRSFGSLQGIVGWCLRGRCWRRRKNSHQWKEHRCSLRGKFYPIREWHFLKDRHSQNIWYTDTFYKRMFFGWFLVWCHFILQES